MVEVALVGLLAVVALVAYAVLQRRDPGAIGLWLAASGAICGAGVSDALIGEARWAPALRCVLPALAAALVLSGALAYARLRPWVWLVPLGLAVGTARALALEAGLPGLSLGVALAFEPGAVLLAALLVLRRTRREATVAERALGPALIGFAGLGLFTLLVSTPGEPISLGLLRTWVAAVPLGVALQIAAVSNRRQAALARSRDQLELRVAERTADLARSVAALRESEERYRMVSELSSDYSFAVRLGPDLSVQFEWITKPIPRIGGFEIDHVEDRRWIERIPPEDRDDLMARIRQVVAGEADRLELRFTTRLGETRWMSLRLGKRERQADGTVRMFGAGRDISELKRAEEERRRLDALVRERQRAASLGLLAGGIAHDFNNVLTIIRGNARLALDELGPDSPTRERLTRIQATAEYASELTEQMLAYSGKASVALRPLDLSRLVREGLDLMRASVGEKRRLEVELAGDLPPIRGDATQLRQVLLNLVGNASEAIPDEGGSIEVRTGRRVLDAESLLGALPTPDPAPGEYVYLEIRDTGPGIDDAIMARIFEPFFTTKSTGRGLGLAAAFGIVSSHRGVLQIDRPEGGGTVFRVLFPAASGAEQSAPGPGQPAPNPQRGAILVVDDDAWVLELAREFLRRDGWEVWTARSGEAALEMLRGRPAAVAAVVLDLVMPEMDGEETLLALRRIRPDLPAVLASGYDGQESAERLSGQGMVRFVQKPYAPEQLTERVREVLGA